DVDAAGNATIVRVRSGEGQAWGEGAAYTVGAGQQATFVGEGLRDYSFDAMSAADEFDSWCFERNRREDNSVAGRYVSPDIVGYSDLDNYGAWRSVEGYGNVWFPTAVAADWAPYRNGHWAWVDPWGWTWVDDAPWGFAPFHYGRWAYVSTRWCWVPGPIAVRPVYAPALVAFVGGAGFSLALSTGAVAGIAWFPLGPGEVYRPAYAASQNYFTSVNVSNTVVNTTVINNVYNNNVTNIVYRNRELPGAVTAVPTSTFSGAQPVAGHAVPVSAALLAREPVGPVASITPTRASVLAVGAVAAGAAAVAIAHRPPAAVLARPVVARTPPPPPPPAFSAKASLLAAHPGAPLEADRLKTLQPARSADVARVKVVAPSVAPQPLSKNGAGQNAHTERAAVPQPPVRNGQASGAVPQPPASVQERTLQERKGSAQGAAVPQPPARTPQGAGAPQPSAAVQERTKQERSVAQPAAQAPQQAKERAVKSTPPAPQPAAQERAQHENRAVPPPAPKSAPPERTQKAPPPPPPPAQGAKAEPKPKQEENKAKEKEKEHP